MFLPNICFNMLLMPAIMISDGVLNASDALVMVDEAYFEFSRRTVRPLLDAHENLVSLPTRRIGEGL